MTDKLQINNVIEAVLEEHVAATRSQRVQIRELLLDAIEGAGFDIVGKGSLVGAGDGNTRVARERPHPNLRPHLNDYAKTYMDIAHKHTNTLSGERSALDEDDEDIQSLMDRDRE